MFLLPWATMSRTLERPRWSTSRFSRLPELKILVWTRQVLMQVHLQQLADNWYSVVGIDPSQPCQGSPWIRWRYHRQALQDKALRYWRKAWLKFALECLSVQRTGVIAPDSPYIVSLKFIFEFPLLHSMLRRLTLSYQRQVIFGLQHCHTKGLNTSKFQNISFPVTILCPWAIIQVTCKTESI